MKILAVGDSFVPTRLFETGLASLAAEHQIRFIQLDMDAPFVPMTPSERAIRECAGNPQQLVNALDGDEILLVHGAPVTDAVLDASPNLKLVGVARGGPVNVDLAAASDRGIAVITAPGRNADAVADLTLAYMVMLARGIMIGFRGSPVFWPRTGWTRVGPGRVWQRWFAGCQAGAGFWYAGTGV